jgi:hypothetical protein
LYRLRKALGEETAHDGVARFVVIESDRLGLEPWGIELDLKVLQAAVSLSRRETSSAGRSSEDAVRHRDLIVIWRGFWGSTVGSSWRASP